MRLSSFASRLSVVAVKLCAAVVVVAPCVMAAPTPAAEEKVKEPATELVLTEGIVGGFVPPHQRLQVVLVERPGGGGDVAVKQSPARNAAATYKTGRLSAEDLSALTAQLKKLGLLHLPTELPPGCQDIYRLDTSLAVELDGRFWRNGGPAGCVHGQSKVQPTDAQRKTFAAAVKAVKATLVDRKLAAATAAEYQKLLAQANVHRCSAKAKRR